jgi:hypothetical protein
MKFLYASIDLRGGGGSGFWVQGSEVQRFKGSGVQGSEVLGSGFRVLGSGFRGSGFRVQGSGFRGPGFCVRRFKGSGVQWFRFFRTLKLIEP